jgi:hypothetical protein
MKIFLTILFIGLCIFTSRSQELHDPQNLYNLPGSIFDVEDLHTIDLNFYDSNYDSILQSYWFNNIDLKLPARLTLDNSIILDTIGVAYKGNSTFSIPQSFNNPKLPYNLDINYFVGGQKLMNYKKLKLANAIFDPTFVKEITAYKIYRKYLPSPEANLMKLNVQGNYLGLYVNTESVNKEFLKKHFGEKDGILFKCDPIQQFGQPGPSGNSNLAWLGTDTTQYYNHYSLKSDFGWEEIMKLTYALNVQPDLLDSILNIDRVLWAFAANTVITNLDTYNGLYQHNYYLYQTGDGLFQMIPWDASESFLAGLLGHNPNPTALYEYDPYNGYNCFNQPLVANLISNPNSKYGKIYSAHIRTILNESFNADTIKAFTNSVQATGALAAFQDQNKLFTMNEFTSNVNNEFIIPGVFSTAGIISTVNIRKPFLENNSEISKVGPSISTINVSKINGSPVVTAYIENTNNVELMLTTSVYNSKFKPTQMVDDGTNGDLVANDQIYSAIIPDFNTTDVYKFYVKASNEDAIKLNPERAEYEFYYYQEGMHVDEIENQNLTTVYPNPTADKLHIKTKDNQNKSIQLFDLRGNLILEMNSNLLNSTLDLSYIDKGVYLLKIGQEIFKIKKI